MYLGATVARLQAPGTWGHEEIDATTFAKWEVRADREKRAWRLAAARQRVLSLGARSG